MKSNSPKAGSGFTAVSAWLFSCIMFVFGALVSYTIKLFEMKKGVQVRKICHKIWKICCFKTFDITSPIYLFTFSNLFLDISNQ